MVLVWHTFLSNVSRLLIILGFFLFLSSNLLLPCCCYHYSHQQWKKKYVCVCVYIYIYIYLCSKELYTFIIQNFVYTSFPSQKFVYKFLKSMSFLKMGLIWVFSCQNFDGSIILSYTKGSVSTSWEYASEWMNVFSYCCLFEIIGNVPRLLGFLI